MSEKKVQKLFDWKKIIEDLPESWVSVDMSGKFMDCNTSYETLTGYSKDELCRKSFFDTTPAGRHDAEKKLFDEIVAGKNTSHVYEKDFITKDGVVIPIETSVSLILEDDKTPVGMWAVVKDISRRKEERDLLIKEKMYSEAFIDSLPGLFYVYNEEMGLIRWNKNFEFDLGYPAEELTGKSIFDFITDEGKKKVAGVMEDISTDGFGEVFTNILTKRGEEIPYHISGVPIELEGQDCFLGVAFDQTRFTKVQQSLEASEENFKRILDNMPVGYFHNDLAGNVIMANQETADLLGYDSIEEFLRVSMKTDVYVNPEDRDVLLGLLKRNGMVRGYQIVLKKKNGEVIHVEVNILVIKNENGEMLSLEGIFHDITKRVEVEAKLQKSLFTLESVLNSAAVGVGMIKDGLLFDCNETLCKILGFSKKEFVGSSAKDFYAFDADYQKFNEKYWSDKEDEYFSFESRMKRKDGELVNTLISMSPLNPNNLEEGYSFTLFDITGRVKAEQELRTAHEELENRVAERTDELSKSVTSLEQRNKEIELLTEMGDLLQVCETEEESYNILSKICARLWPDVSGYLGIYDKELDLTIVEAHWGEKLTYPEPYPSSDCWSLRLGKPHSFVDKASDLVCSHHLLSLPGHASVCVPISGKGENIGVLTILLTDGEQLSDLPRLQSRVDEIQNIATRTTELFSLALANIRLRKNLHEQSIRDSLTGLFNRSFMEESLAREFVLAKRRKSSLCLMMLDVDHFKKFNDDYGHETGDEVLRRLGGEILKHMRASDIVCRYGGEEILIILPDCLLEIAQSRAETLRKGIEDKVKVRFGDQYLNVTVSIGVSINSADLVTREELISAADQALYKAKKAGRNNVQTAENGV